MAIARAIACRAGARARRRPRRGARCLGERAPWLATRGFRAQVARERGRPVERWHEEHKAALRRAPQRSPCGRRHHVLRKFGLTGPSVALAAGAAVGDAALDADALAFDAPLFAAGRATVLAPVATESGFAGASS